MARTEVADPVADRMRSVALAVFALSFVFLLALWSGIVSNLLWLTTIVTAFFGGFVLLQEGVRTQAIASISMGILVLIGVFAPFILLFTGAGHLGGPSVPIALTLAAAYAAWGRLGMAERGVVLVGATGVVAFMAVPTGDPYGHALLLGCGAIMVLALILAATKQHWGSP